MQNVAVYNRIEDTDTGAGNVLSENEYGISIYYASGLNTIEGNLIGTDAIGEHAIGNIYSGIDESDGNDTIGGTTSVARNVISGNHNFGVPIENASYVAIVGNFISTDATGTADLGNLQGGSLVGYGPSFNTIGGMGTGAANTIGSNPGAGVTIGSYRYEHSLFNSVVSSSIHANTGPGIDLGNDGVSSNTPGTQFLSPKDFQSCPELDSSVGTSSNTIISGILNSSPGKTFTIEFFANPLADPSGYGKDQTYLGSTTVNTDSNGDATFTLTLDIGVPAGQVICATTMDYSRNTSEFCQDLTVTAGASQVPIRAGSPSQGFQARDVSSESIRALDLVLSSTNQPDEAALLELAMELTPTAQPRSKPVNWIQGASSRFFQRPGGLRGDKPG